MKLVHPEIETHFDFDNGDFHGLVIENPCLFSRFIEDIYSQTCGNDGLSVLSQNDISLSISDNVTLITDYFNFEMNNKRLLGKIYSNLQQQSLSPQFYDRTQQALSEIEKLFIDFAFNCGLDLDFPNLSVAGILKSSGFCLKDDYGSLGEKLLDYMKLSVDYGFSKLFVFVNLRSYLDDKESEAFTTSCCMHDFNLLLVDNHTSKKLSREIRTTIDLDLCEI